MAALAQTCSEVGTETENRVGASVSCALVDFLFLSRVLHLPRVQLQKQSFKLQVATQDDLRVPIPLSPPLPFNFPFSYTSRLAPLDNAYRHKTATTRQPYDTPPFPGLSFVAYTLSIQSPSPAPPRTAIPYKT